MSLICQHLHSSCMSLLYDSPQIRTDSIIGRVIYKNCHRIRILIHSLLHLTDFHAKGNAQLRIHLRVYINRNCTAQYQGIDGTFMYISRQNDLIPCLADRQDHALHCRCGSSYHKECMRCAKSICCKLLRFSDHRNRMAEIVQWLLPATVQAPDFLFLFYVPAHQRERLSSFENVPVLHIWAHAVVFHNPFDMFLFSCRHVPANTVLSFSNCILPQTGTMIQLFLYIFKSNACETHPRKAFISNHILYICYICTKKEADKFIHHLLLS